MGAPTGLDFGLRKIFTCNMDPTLGSARPLDLDQLGYGASAMTVTCALGLILACNMHLLRDRIWGATLDLLGPHTSVPGKIFTYTAHALLLSTGWTW